MKSYIKILIVLLAATGFVSCEKFVDIEPKGQLIPSTLSDFRMMLDAVQKINFTGSVSELAADNMYYTDLEFQQLSNTFEKNAYTWNKDIYISSDQATDWNVPYDRIYNANVILEGLEKISTVREVEKNTIKGEALFLRGLALYEVASLYAASYDPATAATTPGVPIRTSSDVFEVSVRPTLQETYDQILDDLTLAAGLLPNKPEFKTRASKASAYGVLARVYLDMRVYDLALENALNVLGIQAELMDYNTIDKFAWPKFEVFNPEMIYLTTVPNFAYSFDWNFPINGELYALYDDDDLRKELFFDVFTDPGTGIASIGFSGNYAGSWQRFTGLATDEVYLIAAECYIRDEKEPEALSYLNQLLEKRYRTGTFTPFESSDETEILHKIIVERRKELVARNSRWADLKRYNCDSRFAITLERTVQGTLYSLPPNDPKYVFPLPLTVISATGMEQNPR